MDAPVASVMVPLMPSLLCAQRGRHQHGNQEKQPGNRQSGKKSSSCFPTSLGDFVREDVRAQTLRNVGRLEKIHVCDCALGAARELIEQRVLRCGGRTGDCA